MCDFWDSVLNSVVLNNVKCKVMIHKCIVEFKGECVTRCVMMLYFDWKAIGSNPTLLSPAIILRKWRGC